MIFFNNRQQRSFDKKKLLSKNKEIWNSNNIIDYLVIINALSLESLAFLCIIKRFYIEKQKGF